MGDFAALAVVLGGAALLLGAAIVALLRRVSRDHAIAAASVSVSGHAARGACRRAFAPTSPERALRHKEWTLLRRDPWLVSQTLMQILYLLPPALFLWRNFGDGERWRSSCWCRCS